MQHAIPGRRRFISTFVNEMYAILLGLGMVEVVFADNFRKALSQLPAPPILRFAAFHAHTYRRRARKTTYEVLGPKMKK